MGCIIRYVSSDQWTAVLSGAPVSWEVLESSWACIEQLAQSGLGLSWFGAIRSWQGLLSRMDGYSLVQRMHVQRFIIQAVDAVRAGFPNLLTGLLDDGTYRLGSEIWQCFTGALHYRNEIPYIADGMMLEPAQQRMRIKLQEYLMSVLNKLRQGWSINRAI